MTTESGSRYFVLVDTEYREIVVGEDGLTLDGHPVEARVTTLPGSDRMHLRFDGRSVPLFVRRMGSSWVVELEGRRLDVTVEDERTRRIRELAAHASPTDTSLDLKAPMPGLIVRVEVLPGQEVEAGQGLVVMEAMKMENELRANVPCRVMSVEIEAGQAVERDAILLRLERR